ncbi:MAG: hypothetical protein V6D39_03180 [Dolichospermum lemmermannii FEM_B0920]
MPIQISVRYQIYTTITSLTAYSIDITVTEKESQFNLYYLQNDGDRWTNEQLNIDSLSLSKILNLKWYNETLRLIPR